MMGFVSALSSAVAIMVLIMVIMFSRKLTVEINNDKAMNEFVTSLDEVHSDERESEDIIASSSGLFDFKSIDKALITDSAYIICSYGELRSKATADKFAIYNLINLRKSFNLNVEVKDSYFSSKSPICEIRKANINE